MPSPETAATWSATAYFFGRQLYQDRKVPVGVIEVPPERLASLAPFSVRGLISFSEGAAADAAQSRVAEWRKAWGRTDLPVLSVRQGNGSAGTAGVVVVNVEDIQDGQEVGGRLAAAARALETSASGK